MINSNNILFISCVYDGFKIFNMNNLNCELEISDLHKSIVYGVETRKLDYNSILINSCSFYDNSVILWKYSI
jgi:hypothetical protein